MDESVEFGCFGVVCILLFSLVLYTATIRNQTQEPEKAEIVEIFIGNDLDTVYVVYELSNKEIQTTLISLEESKSFCEHQEISIIKNNTTPELLPIGNCE